MSDVVVNNAPVAKEVKKRKSSSRVRDTSVGSKLKITVLKTKMNNLVVGGSGLVVDKNDIMKLDKDFEDLGKSLLSSTLSVVGLKDLVKLNDDERFFLDETKYYGYLSKVHTKISGVDKFEVKFYKVTDGYKLLSVIMNELETTTGLKLTYTHNISVYRNCKEYSFDLTTVAIKLTNDSWDVKRKLGKIYDIANGNYNTDHIRTLFTGNMYFLPQEYMSNVELTNELNISMNTCVGDVVVSTVKESFSLPKRCPITGTLMFGRVQE